ncbi:charged multivesicular body protein 3 [Anastrepha obliqua]|uniref:charged multivesicular body protein 3 n=1 Tax=Anastrepha ludens TaxID=28586 RepID=UPI0023B132E1|nr:charged multivesicular body protein 3 [Anastrepha ludens]XP_054731955.1 charged multivesicular body protein 3 [Anastrepha obliqua]
MGLFGKTHTKDPKEQVQEWTHKIRKEGNQLDRQIRSIQREEEKVKRSLKQAAAKNDRDTCIILAKEIVRARKAINRIYTSKAHLNSIQLQMKNQLSTLRVAGSLQKSTEVMQAMQNLVRYPELAGIMRDMSKEMMKAGIIEEMLDETMDSLEESEEMEEEAAKEVDKVLWEITNGKLGEAPLPPEGIAAAEKQEVPAATVTASEDEAGEEEEDLQEMQSRLASLRS